MSAEAKEYVILLGSNVDKERCLPLARSALESRFEIRRRSSVYASDPVGAPGTPEFHNQALLITGVPDSTDLRSELREIERALGRIRNDDPNAPRTIDIDVVYEIDPTTGRALQPDPDLGQQHHVTVPVAEIDPTRRLEDGRMVATIVGSLGPNPPSFRLVPAD